MNRRRPLATALASLALHGGVILAVLVLVSREAELGALFIDLTEWAETRTAGDRVAAPPAPAARRAARRAPARPERTLPLEPPAPAPAAAARPVESASSPAAVAEAPVPAPPTLGTGEPRGAEPAVAPALSPGSREEPTRRSPAGPALSPGEPRGADATVTGGPGASPRRGRVADRAPADGGQGSAGLRGGAPSEPDVRGGGSAPDVSKGFALATPSAGPTRPGAAYGPYLSRLRQRIQESLTYPLAARRRGLAGTVSLEIVIHPNGTFSVVSVADSSSHAVLDDAALETVRRLAPEPFPSDVPPRILRVRLPVVFALE